MNETKLNIGLLIPVLGVLALALLLFLHLPGVVKIILALLVIAIARFASMSYGKRAG